MTKHQFIVTRSMAPKDPVTDEYLPLESTTEGESIDNTGVVPATAIRVPTGPYFDEQPEEEEQ